MSEIVNSKTILINREKLLEEVEKYRPMNWTDSEAEIAEQNCYNTFKQIIKDQPIIRISNHDRIMKHPKIKYDIYSCPNCDCKLRFNSDNFCPNCGAKMREQRTNYEKIKQMTVEEMVEFINCEGLAIIAYTLMMMTVKDWNAERA